MQQKQTLPTNQMSALLLSSPGPGGTTTPAHIAAKANDTVGLAAALAAAPGDIIVADAVGFTPLHAAAAKNAAAAVALLISEGASETVRDMNGRTPLEVARRVKATSVVILLDPDGPEARAALTDAAGTQELTNEQLEASLSGLNLGSSHAPTAPVCPLPVGSRAIGQWRGYTWNSCVVDSVSVTGYSVTFWDSEKATGVPEAKLSPRLDQPAFASPPKAGDRVRVERFGFDWFPCRISGAADGMYEVTYDDGVVEQLAAQHVRLELNIGARVLAQWRGFSWMPATVTYSTDTTCSVAIDGEPGVPEVVPLDAVRTPGSSASLTAAPATGTRVEAMLFGRAWFPGVVKGKAGGISVIYIIVFDDDGTENHLTPSRVRSQ